MHWIRAAFLTQKVDSHMLIEKNNLHTILFLCLRHLACPVKRLFIFCLDCLTLYLNGCLPPARCCRWSGRHALACSPVPGSRPAHCCTCGRHSKGGGNGVGRGAESRGVGMENMACVKFVGGGRKQGVLDQRTKGAQR